MALSLSSLSSIPVSFASCSIGKPTTPLTAKLNALHKAGFRAIELSMPDLVNHANIINKRDDVSDSDFKTLTAAAHDIAQTLRKLEIHVMLMQPFANFEGWPKGSSERKEVFERAHGWIGIMEAVGCKTLQVGSTDTPAEKISTDRDTIVADLRELADQLKEKGMRMAYENWCWSTHAPGWAEVWDIVRRVDRDNVGLCLDTFQTAGGEWGDPRTKSGLVETQGGKEALEKKFKESMQQLSETVPKEKIYLLQISDAYRMEEPLEDEVVDDLRPRGRWSHDFRPLPFEGYLPTVEVATAVLKTGFRGWFSYEVFDTPPWKKDEEVEDLEGFAFKAMSCQGRFLEACSKQH